MTILTADSSEVFSQEALGETYKIEDLNDVEHIIRAYIDKNENEIYDNESEPYFQKSFDPVNSTKLDIYLAYADTLKPQLKFTNVIFNNSINVTFTEPISSFSEVSIRTADSLETKLIIKAY